MLVQGNEIIIYCHHVYSTGTRFSEHSHPEGHEYFLNFLTTFLVVTLQ